MHHIEKTLFDSCNSFFSFLQLFAYIKKYIFLMNEKKFFFEKYNYIYFSNLLFNDTCKVFFFRTQISLVHSKNF